jgi:DNA-damage-inducible protein J
MADAATLGKLADLCPGCDAVRPAKYKTVPRPVVTHQRVTLGAGCLNPKGLKDPSGFCLRAAPINATMCREEVAMSKAAIIRARIEPRLKSETEDILRQLGLSTTEAITLFYHQVRLNRGLPFEVRLPNKTTRKTFADTDAGKNLVRAKDAADLFRKLKL